MSAALSPTFAYMQANYDAATYAVVQLSSTLLMCYPPMIVALSSSLTSLEPDASLSRSSRA